MLRGINLSQVNNFLFTLPTPPTSGRLEGVLNTSLANVHKEIVAGLGCACLACVRPCRGEPESQSGERV
jgi:hypothetical protein